jgi:Ni,Fe-hydrogenase I large subunit
MEDAAMNKQQVSSPDSEVIDQLRKELEEARDEAELNLLQLQQAQEELEHHFTVAMEDVVITKQQVSSPDGGVIEQLQQELEEARDEAELNLLQLQQVQEELEHHFIVAKEDADTNKQQVSSPDGGVIEQLRQELEEARDEAELNLLQLQQVQEELAHHFIDQQRQQQELTLYAQEAMRAERLIAALLEMLEGRG